MAHNMGSVRDREENHPILLVSYLHLPALQLILAQHHHKGDVGLRSVGHLEMTRSIKSEGAVMWV